MDNLMEDIVRGFLRGVGYILADIFFRILCYWIGWPICKIITLGKYPCSNHTMYIDDGGAGFYNNIWCSIAGLLAIVFVGLYFAGQFS